MISRRQIISRPIFAIFSPNENVLGTDDRSGIQDFFFYDISRDVAMATDFVKKLQTLHFRRSDNQKRNGIMRVNVAEMKAN